MAKPCFLNIDKPAGLTSRAVVDRVMRIVGTRRVGHAGTLDPLATGVLVIAIDRATRLVEYAQRLPKTYVADFVLGQTSDTDDREGTLQPVAGAEPPTIERLRAALGAFVGEIEQTPPAFSAVHVEGRRAYDLARRGQVVTLAPRRVVVSETELLEYEYPRVRVRVECGAGTYIRSIGRDLGASLGVGAYMAELRRTAIGPFRVEAGAPIDALTPDHWNALALPIDVAVAELPRVTLDADGRRRFELGQAIAPAKGLPAEGDVAVYANDQFLGIGRATESGRWLRPVKGGFASGGAEE